MRVLVTGANGRLGSRVVTLLGAHGHEAIGFGRDSLDVADWLAVQTQVQATQPQAIIHAAAWTDVDGCAREPERAIRINGMGAQHVALAAAGVGAAVAYVSTNEVFDGLKAGVYYEYDPYSPPNGYGYSKMMGEKAVMHLNPRHYVARTSWLFAHGGKNFIQAILGAVAAGKPLRVVTDETAHPTYTDDLATALVKLISTERYGVYHLVNEGVCSRYDFARYVLDRTGHSDVPIQPITRQDWSRPSQPPFTTHLSPLAAQSAGVALRAWQAAVDAFLEQEGLLKA
jgi:dTDP-4-dehydrorhamnose reductase